MKVEGKMADLTEKHPAISDTLKTKVADHAQTHINTGHSNEAAKIDVGEMADPHPAIIQEFVTPTKAAELSGDSLTTVKRHCRNGKYAGAKKSVTDGIEAWQIPITSLPIQAQRKMTAEVKAAMLERVEAIAPTIPDTEERKLAPAESRTMWEAYERSGGVNKRRAEAALNALCAFHDLVDAGYSISDAEKAVASSHGVSKPTLWRYRMATKGHNKGYWLPLLSPRYKGGRPPAEFTPEAYEYIRGKHKNTSETPLAVVLENARALALTMGWVIPSYDAVAARLAKEPKWIDILGRKGPKALERSFPAVKRSYTSLELHELWESDGRRADVFCVWPDGTVARPFTIVWREARSRLVLSVKGYRNPTAEGVLAAFGQAMERAGTAPSYAKMDNGREYAAKSVTGGQENRYRFKVLPGEQPGVMTHVGTKAEWSRPARGQDKPIESFWRYVADRCDKAAEFEGAYCGRNTVAKPEGFDRKKAIPIAAYGAKLAAVIEYFNNQHRHTGDGMNGRTAAEVYAEMSVETMRSPVDPAHLRMCKMGSATIKPDKVDASYTLVIPGYGPTRYWSKTIADKPQEILSRKHFVYYDLENPESPVSIYDGLSWLGDAHLLGKIPFREENGERAAAHVKAKNTYMRPKILALKNIKAAAEPDLPSSPGATNLSALPPPVYAVSIEDNRKFSSAVKPAPTDAWEPTDTPGELKDSKTGDFIRRIQRPIHPESDADIDEAKLEAMRQKQREKNQPDWMRGNAPSPDNSTHLEIDYATRRKAS